MPGLLARKSPRLALTEGWAWVFPALHPMKHPRTGELVRWRMHEVNVQRAVRAAAEKTGLAGRVTPHVLRHCYATHAHDAGSRSLFAKRPQNLTVPITPMKRPLLSLAALVLAHIVQARDPWPLEQAEAWGKKQPWLVGSNFVPSSAINQLEMWQAETFDLEGIDRELGWAEGLGMNTLRVFLHDLLWEQDAEGFKKRLDQFLASCQKHKIRPVLVLFDSCWDPAPKLGKQREPRPGVHNSGWVQSPSVAALQDSTQWPRLKAYAQGVITAFRDDERILAWDIVNEPGNANGTSYGAGGLKLEPPNKAELGFKLVKEALEWAYEANPSQPITSAPWGGDWSSLEKMDAMARHLFTHSDVLTFHNYGSPEDFERRVLALEQFKRPIICTEYMARTAGSTFQGDLPIAKKHHIGMINWGFVAGKTNTIHPWKTWRRPTEGPEPNVWFHDVLRPDGKAYRQEEVDLIRQLTGKS